MRCVICVLSLTTAFAAVAEWKPAASPLMTEWGERVTPENAWREYPRPQLVRKGWTNLNGLWDYAVTPKANETKGFPESWDGKILVPFPIESPLSGVGRLITPDEFVWYRRTFSVERRPDERTILHFGGVDFRTQVFVNGREVSDVPHEGGQVPFSYDITDFAQKGENELLLCVWDPTRDFLGSCGKQSFKPGGSSYTRMSGIWQTVWTENVPETHLTGYRTAKVDLSAGTVELTVDGVETPSDRKAAPTGRVRVFDGDREVASAPFVFGERVTLRLPTPVKAWSPETPHLYTLRLAYGRDAADGYFAMRTFGRMRDASGAWRFALNGKIVFLLGTLDQGWWPDGFLTPPSEEAMAFDISFLKGLGYNMMRKHLKVEPARYYWLCDRTGILVLQDMPNGDGDRLKRYQLYRDELRQVVDALRVFPSIVMWDPYNEGWGQPGAFLSGCTVGWLRRSDPERLVDGPSGWGDEGCEAADVVDVHSYPGPDVPPPSPDRILFLGEFGGLVCRIPGFLWKPSERDRKKVEPMMMKTFNKDYLRALARTERLTAHGLAGAVFTQTTDVEDEANGLLSYDRKFHKYDREAVVAAHASLLAAADAAARTAFVRTEVIARRSTWAYSFERPDDGWASADFDDGAWKRGVAVFGHNLPYIRAGVDWPTSDLWVRRPFELKDVSSVQGVDLMLYHDDEAEVYLNGQKILDAPGSINTFEPFVLDRELFLKAARKGTNVLAVHVHQRAGSQGFDAVLWTR